MPSEEDFWKHAGCKGYLQPAIVDQAFQFADWKGSSGILSVPANDDVDSSNYSNDDDDGGAYTSLSLPSLDGFGSPTAATQGHSFICSCCSQSVEKSTLSAYAREIMNDFSQTSTGRQQQLRLSPNEHLAALMRAYEKTTEYTTATSYARYETLSTLVLFMINMGLFERALAYSEKLCLIAQQIYPHFHPQVSVFYLQHAKLLRYLYGEMNCKESNLYLEKAHQALRCSHDSTHDIFKMHF